MGNIETVGLFLATISYTDVDRLFYKEKFVLAYFLGWIIILEKGKEA